MKDNLNLVFVICIITEWIINLIVTGFFLYIVRYSLIFFSRNAHIAAAVNPNRPPFAQDLTPDDDLYKRPKNVKNRFELPL